MKTVYENLDKFDFYNGIKRTRIISKILYVVIMTHDYYQMVDHIFCK